MRKIAAIYSGFAFCLIFLSAVSGCGASGGGGCGGGSRAFKQSDVTRMAASHRSAILPMPYVEEANFQFSERSGTARFFKATTGLGGFPTALRAAANEGDTDIYPLPAPGEMIAVGTSGTPCGPTPDWYMTLNVYDGRAIAARRLQAGHSYPLVSNDSTPEEYAKFRIYGNEEAGEFVARSGSVIVESVDEKAVTLRFQDLHFQHIGDNGKPDTHGSFKLSGMISLATLE